MKKITCILCLMLAFGCFLTPIKAAQSIKILFEAGEKDNQGAISVEGMAETNAFSLNLKVDGTAQLDSFEPSKALVDQGARVNYRYDEKTKSLDIFVTAKSTITYDQALQIGSLNFSGNDGAQATILINEAKDGSKWVNGARSSIVNKEQGLQLQANAVTIRNDTEVTDPEPDSTVEIIDRTTGVKLIAKAGSLPAGTVAKVEQVKSGDAYDTITNQLKGLSTKFTAYNITLYYNDEVIQPKDGARVEVYVPVPAGYDKEKLAIYYIGDELEVFNLKIVEDQAVFETSHFSTYVLAETNLITNDPEHPDTPIPPGTNTPEGGSNGQSGSQTSTGDQTNVLLWSMLAIGGGAIAFYGFKKSRKQVKQ